MYVSIDLLSKTTSDYNEDIHGEELQYILTDNIWYEDVEVPALPWEFMK